MSRNHCVSSSRCLCIHSHLQCIDLLLQSLLLKHGILPSPLSLIQDPIPPTLIKTIQGLEGVRNELRAVFRSKHRANLRKVAVCIGPSPFKIVHAYSIPICICDGDDSTLTHCGSPCMELSESEKRTINRKLFTEFPPEEARTHGNRMFIYLNGTDQIITENLEESDPSVMDDKWHGVEFNHINCHSLSTNYDEKLFKWMRIVPFVVQPR